MRYSPRVRKLLVIVVSVLAACKPAGPPPRPQTTWLSPLEQSHPLVGKIWEPARHAEVSRTDLLRVTGDTDYVLLGEAHDNPDHHRLQAVVLAAILARGKRPAVAFEMLEPKQQPLVDAFLASQPASAAGLGAAVSWDKGWPDYREYAPIAQTALVAGVPIRAANIPLDQARAIATGKLTPALPGWDPELERELEDDLVEEHCGMLPREKTAPMALAQRARDARMAEVLLESPNAVLIAGAGHARTDRGVPYYIRAQKPEARTISVGFVEVEPESISPDAYAKYFHAAVLPFDYVWFTPKASRTDPCEGMRARK